MSEWAIETTGVGKLYKLYARQSDKILDAFGLGFVTAWRRHRYQEFWALRDFDLRVARGERIGLVGRNGAGKSTLLKMIAGNIAPTAGNLRVRGRVQALLELGTGFHPEFTGRENIRASLVYQGLSSARIAVLEEEIVDFAELGDFIDQPIKTYSAGMYARLAFSTATAVEPEILIVDEVLGAGDAYFAGKCVDRMNRLTERSGATVLFVSHDLGSVQRLCTRAVWIDRGRIRSQGDTLETLKQYQAEVRRDESERLAARDRKLQQTGRAGVDREDEIYRHRLFRLIAPGAAASAARVRSLRLLHGAEVVGGIDVGGPLDNAASQRHFLMDEPGRTEWGPSARDDRGPFRSYSHRDSATGHAPFQFAVPARLADGDLILEVVADGAVPGTLRVEVHDGTAYVTLGELGERAAMVFPVPPVPARAAPPATSPVKAPADAASERDRRQSDVARIRSVVFRDRDGRDGVVFPAESGPAGCRVELELREACTSLVVALNLYREDGVMLCTQAHRCALPAAAGELHAQYDLTALCPGPGRYLASVGVYRDLDVLDNTREQPALAVWDRAVTFMIEESIRYKLPRGIVSPPLRLRATWLGSDRTSCDCTTEDLGRPD
ncbi:MAG: ABC transporter ATP-binding protein [Planctomycetota bacterium]